MGWNTNTPADAPLWRYVGQNLKAYRITLSGTSIATGAGGERAIDLATLAPDLAAGSEAWLWRFDFAASTGRTMAPVLGVVTDPEASLEPYVISFAATNRSGAGNSVLPRPFTVPENRTLYLRPGLDSTGDLRVVLIVSQFGVP